jgi:hypothetical protein
MRRCALRDDQWDRIKGMLPGLAGSVGGDRGRQSAVRRGGAVPIPIRYPLARPAGMLRRLEQCPSTLQPLGEIRYVESWFFSIWRVTPTMTTQ